MKILFVVFVLWSHSPEYRCQEACEVLDMDYVGTEGCDCVCQEPATKDEVRFDIPDC